MKFIQIAALACGLAGLYFGVSWFEQRLSAPADGWNVPSPAVVDGSGLRGTKGEPFDLKQWRGKWVLVYFGFLSCPDVCPMTLAYANGEYRALSDEEKSHVEVLFVSVDPKRDAPENIGQFVANFNPAFKGVTGDEARLQEFAKNLGAWFHYEDTVGSAMGYTVHHSTDLFLVDPQGRWVQYYRMPLEKGVVAGDLQKALVGRKTT